MKAKNTISDQFCKEFVYFIISLGNGERRSSSNSSCSSLYSPDLEPSDLHLSGPLKQALIGRSITKNNDCKNNFIS